MQSEQKYEQQRDNWSCDVEGNQQQHYRRHRDKLKRHQQAHDLSWISHGSNSSGLGLQADDVIQSMFVVS